MFFCQIQKVVVRIDQKVEKLDFHNRFCILYMDFSHPHSKGNTLSVDLFTGHIASSLSFWEFHSFLLMQVIIHCLVGSCLEAYNIIGFDKDMRTPAPVAIGGDVENQAILQHGAFELIMLSWANSSPCCYLFVGFS